MPSTGGETGVSTMEDRISSLRNNPSMRMEGLARGILGGRPAPM